MDTTGCGWVWRGRLVLRWLFWLSRKQWRARFSPAVRFLILVGLVLTVLTSTGIFLSQWIVHGFSREIQRKLFWFTGELDVRRFVVRPQPFEPEPFVLDSSVARLLDQNPDIQLVFPYLARPVLLAVHTTLHGVILRGVPPQFGRWDTTWLVAGRWFRQPDAREIVLSQETARILGVTPGDDLYVFFKYQPTVMRKVKVVGIYHSGLKELDELFAYMPLATLQQILYEGKQYVSGMLVYLRAGSDPLVVQSVLQTVLPYQYYPYLPIELLPNLFDWLNLHRLNHRVLTALLLIVAGTNLLCLLLALVMERMPFLGMLSTLGFTGRQLRLYLLLVLGWLLLVGVFVGMGFALGLAYLQQRFCLVTLPEQSYYVRCVPVAIHGWETLQLLFIMVGVILGVVYVGTLFLRLRQPAYLLRRWVR